MRSFYAKCNVRPCLSLFSVCANKNPDACSFDLTPTPSSSSSSSFFLQLLKALRGAGSPNKKEALVMNNYLGIGIDAQVLRDTPSNEQTQPALF